MRKTKQVDPIDVAYVAHLRECLNLMDEMRRALRTHAPTDIRKTYGHVGDIAYVSGRLKEIHAFVTHE